MSAGISNYHAKLCGLRLLTSHARISAEMPKMSTYIYPANGGGQPMGYIAGNYVYPANGGGDPLYWIKGDYYYPPNGQGSPILWRSGQYLYAPQGGGPALWYVR